VRYFILGGVGPASRSSKAAQAIPAHKIKSGIASAAPSFHPLPSYSWGYRFKACEIAGIEPAVVVFKDARRLYPCAAPDCRNSPMGVSAMEHSHWSHRGDVMWSVAINGTADSALMASIPLSMLLGVLHREEAGQRLSQ